MNASKTRDHRRSIATLSALLMVLITLSVTPARTAGDACEVVESDGESCVGLNNEITGSCSSADCGVPFQCEFRQLWEIDYIGCTKCTSGGSGTKCKEYKDPRACESAVCKMKKRSRNCWCAFQDCVMDPFNMGNYGAEEDVQKKECIL
jgi:hypothetical protein